MVITFLLSFIGVFGTLTIIAYLRQVEDKMPEVLAQMNTQPCPACYIPHHIPHQHSKNKSMQQGFRKMKIYYHRKKKATFGYRNRTK